MLSPETLALLSEWWKVRTTRYDQDVPVQERWLFPGRRPGLHLTERQVVNRRGIFTPRIASSADVTDGRGCGRGGVTIARSAVHSPGQ
jgi:hypothetical protein